MITEHDRLFGDAYRGEVFGEAFFGALAAREADSSRAEKLRALERIEARTAATLREHASAGGLDVGDDEESRRQGRELAAAAADGGWDTFVRGLHDSLPSFLANFVQLRELAPSPHAPALDELVLHEQVINAFAELELAGRDDLSAAVLHRYLEHSERAHR
jgi:hypothetical protein